MEAVTDHPCAEAGRHRLPTAERAELAGEDAVERAVGFVDHASSVR
jgi:hypothetical protein